MQSRNLLRLLKDSGAMLEGHFLLTSGRHSNIYIEKFRILENPISLNEISILEFEESLTQSFSTLSSDFSTLRISEAA